MQMYMNSIHGILQPAELAKPLWDGEASYAMNGFTNAYTDPGHGRFLHAALLSGELVAEYFRHGMV